VTILPALLALGEGERQVGFFDSSGVAEQVDGWEHSLDGIRLDVDNHRIGSFFHTGLRFGLRKRAAEMVTSLELSIKSER